MKKITYILVFIVIVVLSALLLWQSATPKGHNIVLIVSDALRKDMLGCYGGEAKTPNIDWLAHHGVLFESAYTTSPGTIHSAISLFAGNYPTTYPSVFVPEIQGAIPLSLGGDLPAALLRQMQYDVKIDTENPVMEWIAAGFEKIKTYDELTGGEKAYIQQIIPITAEEDCYKHMYGLLNYLLTETNDRFFVLKWILDPHSPYDPPLHFKQEMQFDVSQLPKKTGFYAKSAFIKGNYNDIENGYLKALYIKEVESVDQRVGYILKALEYRALLEDTYIVFTADHGESFGDHGEWSHGNNYYEELVHIPLIVAGPGIVKGKRVNAIVSNLDIMETVKELLGVQYRYNNQGASFKNLLTGNPLKRCLYSITNDNAAYFVGANDSSDQVDALRENHYKLVSRKDETYELYNLLDDPKEMHNLSKQNPAVVNEMVGRLKEIREKNIVLKESRKKAEDRVPVNKEYMEQLKALGYLASPEEEEDEQDDDIIINEQNIWIEAEDADTIVRPFEIAADENASNGKFIFTPNGTGNAYTANASGNTIIATYTINISRPGVYFLWGRVKARDGEDNSFFIDIDDNPDTIWNVTIGDSWYWNRVNMRDSERWDEGNNRVMVDPVKFNLTTGVHTLRIKLREDGAQLDKLLLTNAMGTIPSGKGDAVETSGYSEKY